MRNPFDKTNRATKNEKQAKKNSGNEKRRAEGPIIFDDLQQVDPPPEGEEQAQMDQIRPNKLRKFELAPEGIMKKTDSIERKRKKED